MSELEHIPAILTQQELQTVLVDLYAGFMSGDTLEGFIEFILNDEKTWLVKARYRIGNQDGQGGLKMIGSFEEVIR